MQSTGSLIKAAREARGVTRTWLAAQLQVAECTVRRYEMDLVDIGLSRLSRIAETLGVSTRDLVPEARS